MTTVNGAMLAAGISLCLMKSGSTVSMLAVCSTLLLLHGVRLRNILLAVAWSVAFVGLILFFCGNAAKKPFTPMYFQSIDIFHTNGDT